LADPDALPLDAGEVEADDELPLPEAVEELDEVEELDDELLDEDELEDDPLSLLAADL
jgi:hypothetical protein